MNDLPGSTLGKDGFKPLLLPDKGSELLENRQYVLTPLARAILDKIYGIRGIPTVVLCLNKQRPESILLTLCIYKEDGVTRRRRTRMELPAQDALFKVQGTAIRFNLYLDKLEETAQFYDESHKLPGCDEKETAEVIKRKEEDWFRNSSDWPINRKFRGCTLRWWSRNYEETTNTNGVTRTRVARTVDLSIFD